MNTRQYFWVFQILVGLFLLRVLAQLAQLFLNVNWLPSFETWQSGALPYKFLLVFQIVILVILFRIIAQFWNKSPLPNRSKGKLFLTLGGVYFLAMIIRVVLGLTVAKNHFWFDAPLPSFFHLIHASIVLILGYYHYKNSRLRI